MLASLQAVAWAHRMQFVGPTDAPSNTWVQISHLQPCVVAQLHQQQRQAPPAHLKAVPACVRLDLRQRYYRWVLLIVLPQH
jgi:hypothetical protein